MAKNMNTATTNFLSLGAGYDQGLDTIAWASRQSVLWEDAHDIFEQELLELGGRLVENYDEECGLILTVVGLDDNAEVRKVADRFSTMLEDAHAHIADARKAGERLVKKATGMIPDDLTDAIRWYQMTKEANTTGEYIELRRKPAKDGSMERTVTVKRSLETVLVEMFENLGMGNVTGYTAMKFASRFIERVYTGKCSGKTGSHAFKPVNKKSVGKDCMNILLDTIFNGAYRPDRNDDGSFVLDEFGNKKFVKCGGGYHLERDFEGEWAVMTAQNQKKDEDNGEFALSFGKPMGYKIVRNA